MPLALLVLQALPQLLQTGFAIRDLVVHTNSVPSLTPSPAEEFAAQLLNQLPILIDAGVDVLAMVTSAAGRVQQMTIENRGPTAQEKADQTARLKALDEDFDKAAR